MKMNFFKKLMLNNPRFRYTMYFLNAIWVSIQAVFEQGIFNDDILIYDDKKIFGDYKSNYKKSLH